MNLKSHFAQPNSIEFKPAVQWKQPAAGGRRLQGAAAQGAHRAAQAPHAGLCEGGLPSACEAVSCAWGATLGWMTLSTDAGGEGLLQYLVTSICGWSLLTTMHSPSHGEIGGTCTLVECEQLRLLNMQQAACWLFPGLSLKRVGCTATCCRSARHRYTNAFDQAPGPLPWLVS